jgi:octaprenyl-diphosphate synthase
MSILSSPASVLIGDYWLVKAIRRILDAERYSERAIRLFAKTLSDLAEGEMLQLEKASSCDTTREDYLRIVYSKTASLFEASVLSGAVSAGAPEEWTAALAGYARNLGITFQIKDDILDYAGDEALGKPVGIDLKEQKITLPLLGAMAAVPEEEADGIRRKLMEIHDRPACKDEIRDFVMSNGGMEYSASTLDSYVEKAVRALDVLPDSKEKDYLVKIAAFTAARDR